MIELAIAHERERLARMEQIYTVWAALSAYLREERAVLVEKLILQDDNEARGRIRQLDDLLRLPDTIAHARNHLNGLAE